jgi:D-alanyl-D-alanine carboxypeptidase/D-alanyl-D-alanine-endopeptidase (penicillin-binding protein 4)
LTGARFSTNLTAEVVGLRASGAGTLRGSALVMTQWAQRHLGVALALYDHSGLNSASRVTALDMLAVMQGAKGLAHGALLEGLMRDVGLADDSGAEQTSAATRIHAKSGTMNFVSGLAGSVRDADGQALAFAIFAEDLARRTAVPVWDREDPVGSGSWAKRARRMQAKLIAQWASDFL